MASTYTIRRAEASDSDALKRLMKDTTQDSRVTIGLEREPDFFYGTGACTPDQEVYVVDIRGSVDLAGCSSMGARDVYVDGRKRAVRYANDLRIRKEHRGGTLLMRLFKAGRSRITDDEYLQSHILKENELSLSVLQGSGRAGLPSFYPYGDYRLYMLYYFAFNKPAIKSPYEIRRATGADIDAMQRFFNREAPRKQFYPHYDFAKVGTDDPYYRDVRIEDYFLALDRDEVVGITGVWNQKRFKQTRFVAYHWVVRALRPAYNAAANVVGGFYLPEPGHTLNYRTLHTILTRDNDVEVFRVLLRTIYRAYRGNRDRTLIIGLMENDPLTAALKGYRKQTLPGQHFLLTHGADPRPGLDGSRIMYLEASRL